METYWEVPSQSWVWEDDAAFDASFPISDWTLEEDWAFQNALYSVHEVDVERWEKIARRVPGKTIEELKRHYEALSRSSIRSPGSSMPKHPKEGPTNDGKKLSPKEAVTNIGSQMLPPTPFSGTRVRTDAGVCTSPAIPPAGSFGVPSTSYSEYIDPDEFKNFPHFLD